MSCANLPTVVQQHATQCVVFGIVAIEKCEIIHRLCGGRAEEMEIPAEASDDFIKTGELCFYYFVVDVPVRGTVVDLLP